MIRTARWRTIFCIHLIHLAAVAAPSKQFFMGRTEPLDRETGFIVATVAACLLLILSRKPDAFLEAQFWAEDGVVWYKQAYEIGWRSLLSPQNGYFQTISKIAGNFGQLVSLPSAPLVFSLMALFFKLLPILLLNASRGRQLVPNVYARLLLCGLYVAHPYSWEVFINVTNIHWHLALSALLVLCFSDWDGAWRKTSDCVIILLCGLSGTFSLFLAPIAALQLYRSRTRRACVLASILTTTAAIQMAALALTGAATRSAAPLDASWNDLFRIVGGQVVAAGLLGDGWSTLFGSSWWQQSILVPLTCCVIATFLMTRAFTGGGHTLRALIILSMLVFAAALIRPQISSTQSQWPLFTHPNIGGRYAFLPIVAFHASLVFLAMKDRHIVYRWIARFLLAILLVVGVPKSWSIQPYEDVGFSAKAEEFEHALPGTTVDIPINPPGWSFRLEKR